MTEMNIRFLTLKYPTLKMFIIDCVNWDQIDELYDFLIAVETDEFVYSH